MGAATQGSGLQPSPRALFRPSAPRTKPMAYSPLARVACFRLAAPAIPIPIVIRMNVLPGWGFVLERVGAVV